MRGRAIRRRKKPTSARSSATWSPAVSGSGQPTPARSASRRATQAAAVLAPVEPFQGVGRRNLSQNQIQPLKAPRGLPVVREAPFSASGSSLFNGLRHRFRVACRPGERRLDPLGRGDGASGITGTGPRCFIFRNHSMTCRNSQ